MIYAKVHADGSVEVSDYLIKGFVEAVEHDVNTDLGIGIASVRTVHGADGKLHLYRTHRTPDWRNNLTDGFIYKGHKFSIDAQSISFINAKVTKLLINPSVDSVLWKPSGEEVPVEFTREEFIQFAEEVSDYIESLVLS